MKNVCKYLGVLSLVALIFPFGQNVSADTLRTDFIDVSHHNAESGLSTSFYTSVKTYGVKGVAVKVSEGTNFLDPAASANIANAKKAGLVVSAYHFARYTTQADAVKEADFFASQLQKVGFSKSTDGYIVDDIEVNSGNVSAANLTAYTNAFIGELQRLGYSRIDIYSSSSFYNNSLVPSQLTLKNPWLARYSTTSPIFANGQGAWQWSSTYTFSGLSNYGSFDVSQDYAGKYTTKPFIPVDSTTSSVLKLGSKGTAVKTLQTTLNAKGFNVGQVDGNFGPVTKKAIEAFQRISKLKVDGIYGPTTAKALSNYKVVKKSAKPVISIYVVKQGDSLLKIAASHKTTIKHILSINPSIHNATKIYIGQKIKL